MAASVLQQTNTEGTYTFASQPRAVTQRKKYRPTQDEDSKVFYGNIMYDRRVIRGNTYSQQVLPTNAAVSPIEIQRQQEARRREAAVRRGKQQQQLRTRTPAPIDGRRHVDVQTELYLEELSDRVEEADVDCQTDAFLDRPPSPLFIPAKSGLDKETQIEEGELFDFYVEAQPVLEVLVGKTLEQSLLEVLEEEELANLREEQRRFEELRNAEMAEYQRLEEQERRHREEKERRMNEQAENLRKEKETMEKIAAHAFAQSYISDLVPAVFGNLANNGYFYDAVEREIETEFMPWLVEQVNRKLELREASRKFVDGLIREVTRTRRDEFMKLQEKELQEQAERLTTNDVTETAAETLPANAEDLEGNEEEEEVDKPEDDGEDNDHAADPADDEVKDDQVKVDDAPETGRTDENPDDEA